MPRQTRTPRALLKSHLAALGCTWPTGGTNQKGMESNEGRRFGWLHCGSCQRANVTNERFKHVQTLQTISISNIYAYASSVISSDRVNCTMHLWSASFYIEENVGSCRLGGFNVNAGAQLRCDCHILPLLSAKSHGSIRVHLHPSPLVPF